MLTLTLEKRPSDATHWSTQSMAKRRGLSQSAVSRIWACLCFATASFRNLPALQDPLFIEKVLDIVGLYLHPPDKVLVLCADEKTQIQARDLCQPLLGSSAFSRTDQG